MSIASSKLARWKSDPVSFIADVLRNFEDGEPFKLYDAQREFVRRAFTLKEGRLPFPEIVFSAPKKAGKSATSAMCALYVALVVGGPFAEVYFLSNDYEQSVGRGFTSAARIVEASPLLRDSAKITSDRIEFPSTGSFIQACASDYSGFAGANPSLCIFDELWAYTSERSQRLWDESVPSPTRRVSGRLTVTYAGFLGESLLLESIYKKGISGKLVAPDLYESDGQLTFWTHRGVAPWQDARWENQMRSQLRPGAFARLIHNQWVSAESQFIEPEWIDRATIADLRPVLSDPTLPVFVGVDAATKHDNAAIAVCTYDSVAKRVRLAAHHLWKPSPANPLNFSETIEKALLEMRARFAIRGVYFDPWQLTALSQRLLLMGLPMAEYPQTTNNLSEMGANLYGLFKDGNIAIYDDPDLRRALNNAVAIEGPRGFKIGKVTASKKIDLTVALAMAALAALKNGQASAPIDVAFHGRAQKALHAANLSRLGIMPHNSLAITGEQWAARMDREDARKAVRHSHRWGRRGEGY